MEGRNGNQKNQIVEARGVLEQKFTGDDDADDDDDDDDVDDADDDDDDDDF